jgi:hypothetical protein
MFGIQERDIKKLEKYDTDVSIEEFENKKFKNFENSG